jgi:uncharacterized protein (DUF924 family)
LEQAPSGGGGGGDATEAKQDTIIADLANGTDGLGALKTLIDAVPTTAMRGTDSAYTGTPPTVAQIQTELEENGASLLDTIRDELANGSDGLTALKTAIDAIPTTAMRGTDSAALASVCTEVRLATCTDWINGGRLDLLIDAIPTTAMRGTDSAYTGTPPTANAIADQVWDETQSSHVAGGSFGAIATEIAALQTDLSNGTDGLGALKALIDTLDTVADGIQTDLSNGTDGLGALKTLVDTVNTDLSNGTDGLGALKTLIDAVPTTKTGYSLVSTGLDLVLVDGKTMPAALQIIAAICGGEISGAGGGTEVFVGLDGATTRATVTVDSSGNRTAVVYG